MVSDTCNCPIKQVCCSINILEGNQVYRNETFSTSSTFSSKVNIKKNKQTKKTKHDSNNNVLRTKAT